MKEIRTPSQKRSIAKKNKIIAKGFELICEKGYYNTTIPDIANYSGVSVGIIYQYFNDKKDIFAVGIKNYSQNIMYPMLKVLNTTNLKEHDLYSTINLVIDSLVQNHTISKKAHEELVAMSHLDKDIGNIFKEFEMDMIKNIEIFLINNNFIINNSLEKIHIIYNLIDNYCHEVVYHQHKEIDYQKMKEEIIEIILMILKEDTKS